MKQSQSVQLSIATALLLLPAVVLARDLVVAPGQPLAARARQLQPGDRLVLKPGVYRESLTLSGLSGTAQAPITIHGQRGVQIQPTERDGILFWPKPCQYIIVEGIKIEGAARAGIVVANSQHVVVRNCSLGNNGVWGIQTTMSDYVTVEGCELYGSKREHGVYFSTTDHPIARGNRIHDNAGCGIHNNGDVHEGGDGMITAGLYENNLIHNNGRRGGAGINMDGVEQSIVRNNTIVDKLAGGIVSFHHDGVRTGAENRFLNNTVYFAPGTGRFGLQIGDGAKDNVVRQNILICGRGPALQVDQASVRGFQSGPNLLLRTGSSQPVEFNGRAMTLQEWQRATGQDRKSLSVDPGFVDSAAKNFKLRPGSPATGMGAGAAKPEGDRINPKHPPREKGRTVLGYIRP